MCVKGTLSPRFPARSERGRHHPIGKTGRRGVRWDGGIRAGDSTVTLFKLEPDGKYANKVKVTFGRSSVNFIEIKDGLRVGDR